MPKLLLCSCQSRNVALLDVSQQPRSRIELLEGLSVSVPWKCVCPLTGRRCHITASQGHATSCFSISSLLDSRGPGSDATGKISGSMCSSSALGACAPWGYASIKISASARCGGCRMVSHRPTCAPTAAANLHWCQQVSWFDPAFQLVVVSNSVHQHFLRCFVPQDTTSCRERGASIVRFGTKHAHAHDGSIDFTHT